MITALLVIGSVLSVFLIALSAYLVLKVYLFISYWTGRVALALVGIRWELE